MPPKARPAGPAGAPPAKRLKGAPPPPSPLSTILIGGNLLTVDQDRGHIEKARQAALRDATKKPAYEALVRKNPTFQKLEQHYATATPLQQQLANLTARSLVRLGTIPKVGNGTLDSVDLRTAPAIVHGSPADYYFSTDGPRKNEQRITFSPNHSGGSNSLKGFAHEGRHALDDIHRTPHQLELINFLAQEEGRNRGTPIDTWLKPLLEGAQNVIGSRDFQRGYTYPSFLKDNIDKSFGNLKVPTTPGSRRTRASKTFEDAKGAIAKDRGKGERSGDAFMGLSEFPAFMTEALGNRFQGPTTPGIHDPSRRFIKENLRTMYRDYDELSGGLAAQYPDVHQAFFDRYNELRNPDVQVSPDTSRQASHVTAGKVTGTTKSALDAFTPGVAGGAPTPNPFPAPKYTTRAKGGHVKNPSQNNFDIKRQLQLLALLSPRLEFL